MTGMIIEKTGASQECKCDEGEEEHGENKGTAEMEKNGWKKGQGISQRSFIIHQTPTAIYHLLLILRLHSALTCFSSIFHCQLCFYSHPFLHFFVLCYFFFLSWYFIYFLFLHLQFIFVWLHSRHVGTSLPCLQSWNPERFWWCPCPKNTKIKKPSLLLTLVSFWGMYRRADPFSFSLLAGVGYKQL